MNISMNLLTSITMKWPRISTKMSPKIIEKLGGCEKSGERQQIGRYGVSDYMVIRYPQRILQMAFCHLLHTFHKQVTNVSQHAFVILLWAILTSPQAINYI